jgi:hypothetical protein
MHKPGEDTCQVVELDESELFEDEAGVQQPAENGNIEASENDAQDTDDVEQASSEDEDVFDTGIDLGKATLRRDRDWSEEEKEGKESNRLLLPTFARVQDPTVVVPRVQQL